jgi:hypothetical protein
MAGSAPEIFHQRGHHVQRAHGRRVAFDASADAHQGAMIALMPTKADAKRLALKGGEAAAELHCTLMFLGGDAAVFDETTRQEIIDSVQMLSVPLPVITSKIFGIAHWNADGESPSWVWSVGDTPEEEGPGLSKAHAMVFAAVEDVAGDLLPEQHSPWVAHVCAAYTDDLTLAKELERRNGPVTFDRIRVSFGNDDTDIPLTGSMTAGGGFHRKPTDLEVASRADFAMIDKQWESAVGSMMRDYVLIEHDQRAELREQITAAIDKDDPGSLDSLHVDTDRAAALLLKHMISYAELAGQEMQREAESQGVHVPPWDLGTALTASTAVDVLTSVARVTARSLGINLVQSAARRVMSYVGSSRSGRTVADLVDNGLKDLSVATPREYIGSAMSASQNTGRMAVLQVAPAGQYLATEIGDKNTCGPCKAIDGTEFNSLSEAQNAYPSGGGGYANCAGGGRCRGTMIAVWDRGEVGSAAVEVITTPWHVAKSSECGSSKPWAVIKDSDGSVEGCHPTQAKANKQLAALYAAEGGSAVGTATETLGGKPNQGTKKDKRLKENPEAEAVTEELGGDPNPGTKKDKRIKENKYADGADVKADDGAAAPGLEGITLNKDGSITDADGNEVTTVPFADAPQDCPPNMEMDPATGECAPIKKDGAAGKTAAWEGVLVVEGETTGDGREFAPDALTYPEGDITPGEAILRWNKEDSHGGETRTKAVAVGRIDKIWKDGNKIIGKGVFDLGQPDGVEAHRRVKDGFLRGVSIDADSVANADVEFVWPDDAGGSDEDQLMEMLFGQPEKMIYHGGRIRAATLCDIPAFIEAYLTVEDETGAMVASAAPADAPEAPARPERPADRLTAALVAHGGHGWRPPAEWFENPQLSMPTTIQVTDEGQIYGHAAQWNVCHIGFAGQCITAPREQDFPYFLTGEVVTADGARVPVGQITVTTNHADLYAASGPAKEHYENTGNAVADVAVGSDSHGIWVAGAIRPNADPVLVHELRASGEVSGDWRRIGGQHRLVGLLGVNVGGFVVPRMRARVAGGEVQALIAAGRLSTAHNRPESVTREQAYKIVMDDLYAQMFVPDTEGSE